jgi:hypothetical protein
MIHASITHLANHLNQFLRYQYQLAEDIVAVSNLLAQDGTVAPHINNKVVVSLVNVEKDTTVNRGNGAGSMMRSAVYSPPIYLNLYVVFAANFSGPNYPEALKFISSTISYFQRLPVFDHSTTPDLDNRIEKLVLDIENLKTHELSNLWTVLSGKYLPSIMYKVRMIAFDSGDLTRSIPNIANPLGSLGRG